VKPSSPKTRTASAKSVKPASGARSASTSTKKVSKENNYTPCGDTEHVIPCRRIPRPSPRSRHPWRPRRRPRPSRRRRRLLPRQPPETRRKLPSPSLLRSQPPRKVSPKRKRHPQHRRRRLLLRRLPQRRSATNFLLQLAHLTFAWMIQLATGTTKPKTASGASKPTKKAPTKATEKQKNTPKSAQRKVRLMFVPMGLLRQ